MINIINPKIVLPRSIDSIPILQENTNVWHQFIIRSKERDRLREYLRANEIDTLIHYPIPPHKQNACTEFGNTNLQLSDRIQRGS
jgi:dTDP-4-amino-4,6-dideoxygalactose transaminase